VIIAAVVTPTPDVFNLMLFAVPMCMLFFVGVFASYILVLKRENRKFPWGALVKWLIAAVVIVVGFGWVVISFYKLHFTLHWPFFVK
jgi:sec-independent protein translocase protein TatC